MNVFRSNTRTGRALVFSMGLVAMAAASGCQISVGGQTLPSGYYLSDDVQYFAPGPEFKLAREAAAQKEASEDANVKP